MRPFHGKKEKRAIDDASKKGKERGKFDYLQLGKEPLVTKAKGGRESPTRNAKFRSGGEKKRGGGGGPPYVLNSIATTLGKKKTAPPMRPYEGKKKKRRGGEREWPFFGQADYLVWQGKGGKKRGGPVMEPSREGRIY